MTGYLFNFVIYTTAMIGVIFLALFTFKNFSSGCFSKKSSMLNIEDTMKLSTRKTLYIIKAKNERFLIAADMERTSLIAKLDDKITQEITPLRENNSTRLSSFDGLESLDEFSSIIDFKKKKAKKEPIMKELAKKLNTI